MPATHRHAASTTRQFYRYGFAIIFGALLLIPTTLHAAQGRASGKQASTRSLLRQCTDVKLHSRIRALARKTLVRRGKTAVPALLREVDSPTSQLRSIALLVLGEIGLPEAEAAILRVTQVDDIFVRFQAQDALADLYSRFPDSILAKHLRQPVSATTAPANTITLAVLHGLQRRYARAQENPKTQAKARAQLLKHSAAVSQFIDHSHPATRLAAAALLGNTAQKSFSPILLKRLQYETNGAVLTALVRALRELGGHDTEAALRRLIRRLNIVPQKKPTTETLFSTFDALTRQRLELEIIATLSRTSANAAKQGAATLGACLLNTARPPGIRIRAAKILGALSGAEALAALLPASKDTDATIRLATVEALTQVADRASVPIVRPLLEDASPRVRAAAAYHLVQLGQAPGAADALLRDLKKPSWRDRATAITGLGRLGLANTLPNLLPLIRSKDLEIACRTVEAIQQIDSKMATPTLLLALQSNRPALVDAARIALQKTFHSDPGNDPKRWARWAEQIGFAWPQQ